MHLKIVCEEEGMKETLMSEKDSGKLYSQQLYKHRFYVLNFALSSLSTLQWPTKTDTKCITSMKEGKAPFYTTTLIVIVTHN